MYHVSLSVIFTLKTMKTDNIKSNNFNFNEMYIEASNI